MIKYVSLKENKLIQNVSDDEQKGFLKVFVPDNQLNTLIEYPSACWVDTENGNNIIHIPDKGTLPNDAFDDLKQNIKDANDEIKTQQNTIETLKNKMSGLGVDELQKSVDTLKQDITENPINGDKITQQIQALGKAIINIQKTQSEANNQQNTQSSKTNDDNAKPTENEQSK